MTDKEVAVKIHRNDGKERQVAWAECGAVTRTDGNTAMGPSRLQWTCHCRRRPGSKWPEFLEKA